KNNYLNGEQIPKHIASKWITMLRRIGSDYMDLHQDTSPNQANNEKVRDLLGTVDLTVLESVTSRDTWMIKLEEIIKQRKKLDQSYLAKIRYKSIQNAIGQRAASLECATSKVFQNVTNCLKKYIPINKLIKTDADRNRSMLLGQLKIKQHASEEISKQ